MFVRSHIFNSGGFLLYATMSKVICPSMIIKHTTVVDDSFFFPAAHTQGDNEAANKASHFSDTGERT